MRHQHNGLENENHLSVMILAENLSSPTQQLIQGGRAKARPLYLTNNSEMS